MLAKNKELWYSLIAVLLISAMYAFMGNWYQAVPAAADFFGHMIGVI